jgi:LPS export ABC transporter protein LptC
MVRNSLVQAVLIIGILFSSCSFNYEQGDAAVSELPDLIVRNLQHRVYREGSPFIELQAERSEHFNTQNQAKMYTVTFNNYDSEGNLTSTGSADNAILDLDTENVSFNGNIFIEGVVEELTIESDYLFWNNSSKQLESNASTRTIIKRADGTMVSGFGFKADSRLRTIEFTSQVSGRIESEE